MDRLLTSGPGCQWPAPDRHEHDIPEQSLNPDDVQRAIDKRTLLPGEDPSSQLLDDALHWISVYAELLTFKRSMLEAAANAMKTMTKDATRDVDIDQQLLRAQARRYVARQEFWVQRAAAIENDLPSDPQPT